MPNVTARCPGSENDVADHSFGRLSLAPVFVAISPISLIKDLLVGADQAGFPNMKHTYLTWPEPLNRAARVHCIETGKTLNQLLTEAIEQYLAKQQKEAAAQPTETKVG